MFLDEELSKIHEENGFSKETSAKLMMACFKRVPNPDEVESIRDWYNEIRKIENGWKLFCKNHHEYKEDGFRLVAKKMWANVKNVEKVFKILGW